MARSTSKALLKLSPYEYSYLLISTHDVIAVLLIEPPSGAASQFSFEELNA